MVLLPHRIKMSVYQHIKASVSSVCFPEYVLEIPFSIDDVARGELFPILFEITVIIEGKTDT